MSLRQRKAFKALAILLAFSFAQVYIQAGFAEPGGTAGTVPLPQQFVATLRTRGNQPITVNGASATSGATILSGQTIETPDQVGATIDLGSLGTLDVAPNTKVTIEFDQNGAKVTIVSGCVILKTRKTKGGEVLTPQGSAGKIDKKTGGALDVCFPPGATAATVNAGAAAAAGAGAAAGTAAAAAGGISTATIIAIVAGAGGVVTGTIFAFRSPSTQ
jgi:hypothetical protein